MRIKIPVNAGFFDHDVFVDTEPVKLETGPVVCAPCKNSCDLLNYEDGECVVDLPPGKCAVCYRQMYFGDTCYAVKLERYTLG